PGRVAAVAFRREEASPARRDARARPGGRPAHGDLRPAAPPTPAPEEVSGSTGGERSRAGCPAHREGRTFRESGPRLRRGLALPVDPPPIARTRRRSGRPRRSGCACGSAGRVTCSPRPPLFPLCLPDAPFRNSFTLMERWHRRPFNCFAKQGAALYAEI